MRIGNKDFNVNNNVYVMGILNVTPDSFSDGNKYNTIDKVMYQIERMIEEGVDIIDVGGESTRPGHVKISDEEEIERVVPIIEIINKIYDIPVSIDTYKANVAKAAFMAGADMLNDIWGLLYRDNMVDGHNKLAEYVKKYNAVVCLMHNDEKVMIKNNMSNVCNRLNKSINEALKYGIDRDKIMVDPGIGFAKTYENNLYVMKNLDKLKSLGYPILLGTSKKSMIGMALDADIDNRLEGTIATTVYGMEKGISFVRVHDVLENVRAIKMIQAIKNI